MQSSWLLRSIVLGVLLNLSTFTFATKIRSSHGVLNVDTLGTEFHHPWGMTFISPEELLVTERRGRLWRFNLKTLQKKEIVGLPVIQAQGQGGLLDVETSPTFDQDRKVFLSYTGGTSQRKSTHVGHGVLRGNKLHNFRTIFRAKPLNASRLHFGSRLVFNERGQLYISLGERGKMQLAQDTSNHAGSMVRINPDGSIPKTNPFLGKPKYQPEIYSYGHRNMQGATLNPWTGAIWAHEHGPRGGDEINIIQAGKNYGWPVVTYGINYDGTEISPFTSKPGLAPPIYHWTPSIAPSGMTFVYGPEFPQWEGDLLVGSLKFRQLRHLVVKGARIIKEEILLDGFDERIRDVQIGPGGIIYVLTDNKNGKLFRITRAKR